MKKIVSIIVLSVVILSLFAFAGCQTIKDKVDEAVVEIDKVIAYDNDGKELLAGEIYQMPSSLTFNASALSAPSMASPGGLQAKSTVRLTATVLPVTAGNKTVDWFVGWELPNSEYATGKEVKEYINVIPDYDGSTLATVECYQPFSGNIFIQAVTREGAFRTPSCVVSFEGIPTDLSLDTSSFTLDGNSILVVVGQDVLIPIVLSNSFNNVGSNYSNFEIVTSVPWGSAGVTCFEDPYRNQFRIIDFYEVSKAITNSDFPDALYTHSVENGNFKIKLKSSIYEMFPSKLFNETPIDVTKRDMQISDIAGARFKFKIIEKTSGVFFEFFIRPVSGVNGVNLSSYGEVF